MGAAARSAGGVFSTPLNAPFGALVVVVVLAVGFVVADRSSASEYSAFGTVNVATSEHQYFSSDSVPVRCTFRLGQNVVRPTRIAKITVNGGGSQIS